MNRRTAVRNVALSAVAIGTLGFLPKFKDDPELMIIERWENGQWVRRQMAELHKGDILRSSYPDGNLACERAMAIAEPYSVTNENGINTWGIIVDQG